MGIVLALESISRSVFLVLVNTSLQVTLLIFLVWAMIRIFRPRSAVARYYLWFLAVFGILALPLFSALLPEVSIPMVRIEETTIRPIYARDIAVDEPLNTETDAVDMPRKASSETDQETTQKRDLWTNVFGPLRQFGLISIISLAWFVIALSMLFRLMGSHVWLRRFKKKSQRVVDGSILEIISRLRERMSLTRGIHVFMSSDIHSPTSFGLFSTTIILPQSLTNSRDEELEMVLSHEMAHAKRRDSLVNLFQRILQSVFFFHPLFYTANRRLAREREHICDDWVIEMTGRRDDYAECLVGLVENAYYLRSISMAIIEHQHNISRRVDMIIDNSRRTITKISRKTGISIFLMGCILLPMLAATQLVCTSKKPMEPVSVILDTEERSDISDESEAEKTIKDELYEISVVVEQPDELYEISWEMPAQLQKLQSEHPEVENWSTGYLCRPESESEITLRSISHRIPYKLEEPGEVTIKIYDVKEQLVRTHKLGQKDIGAYTAYWDGRNDAGEEVAYGVYVYKTNAGDSATTGKLVVVGGTIPKTVTRWKESSEVVLSFKVPGRPRNSEDPQQEDSSPRHVKITLEDNGGIRTVVDKLFAPGKQLEYHLQITGRGIVKIYIDNMEWPILSKKL